MNDLYPTINVLCLLNELISFLNKVQFGLLRYILGDYMDQGN